MRNSGALAFHRWKNPSAYFWVWDFHDDMLLFNMIDAIIRIVRGWNYLFDYFHSNPLLFWLLIILFSALTIIFFICLYFLIKDKI